MSIRPLTFCLWAFLAFSVVISPAYAFMGKEKIPPIKNETKLSKEDFEKKTVLIEETPLDNKDYGFQVRLPKNWIKLDVEVDKGAEGTDIFRTLSTYTSPPRIEQRSVFRVRAIDLTSLMTVDDWFITYMLQMGFSVEGMTIENPRKLVAQYTLFEDGEPYMTRAALALSGSKIIFAEYMVHQDVYALEHDEQVMAMAGFDLQSMNMESPVDMKTFSFVDIAKFDYPAAWTIYSPGIKEINRMDASVINAVNMHAVSRNGVSYTEMQMAGRIDVTTVSKRLGTTIPDEIKTLNAELKAKNFKLGKYIETYKDVALNTLVNASRIDVYELESETQKLAGYEYWVAVLQTGSRYYLVRLITISRGENFTIWAQNTETYRTLLRTLSPASTKSTY
jgi:hypothetical protein